MSTAFLASELALLFLVFVGALAINSTNREMHQAHLEKDWVRARNALTGMRFFVISFAACVFIRAALIAVYGVFA